MPSWCPKWSPREGEDDGGTNNCLGDDPSEHTEQLTDVGNWDSVLLGIL